MLKYSNKNRLSSKEGNDSTTLKKKNKTPKENIAGESEPRNATKKKQLLKDSKKNKQTSKKTMILQTLKRIT